MADERSFDRRGFLKATGASALSVSLAGCGGGGSGIEFDAVKANLFFREGGLGELAILGQGQIPKEKESDLSQAISTPAQITDIEVFRTDLVEENKWIINYRKNVSGALVLYTIENQWERSDPDSDELPNCQVYPLDIEFDKIDGVTKKDEFEKKWLFRVPGENSSESYNFSIRVGRMLSVFQNSQYNYREHARPSEDDPDQLYENATGYREREFPNPDDLIGDAYNFRDGRSTPFNDFDSSFPSAEYKMHPETAALRVSALVRRRMTETLHTFLSNSDFGNRTEFLEATFDLVEKTSEALVSVYNLGNPKTLLQLASFVWDTKGVADEIKGIWDSGQEWADQGKMYSEDCVTRGDWRATLLGIDPDLDIEYCERGALPQYVRSSPSLSLAWELSRIEEGRYSYRMLFDEPDTDFFEEYYNNLSIQAQIYGLFGDMLESALPNGESTDLTPFTGDDVLNTGSNVNYGHVSRFSAALHILEHNTFQDMQRLEEYVNQEVESVNWSSPSSSDQSPQATYSFSPVSPQEGQEVQFDASDSDGSIEEYRWDFGDGTTVSGSQTVQRTFETDGTYEVVLTVVDDAGHSDSYTETLEVSPDISPRIHIQTVTPRQNVPVGFEGEVPPDTEATIESVFWEFGDGSGTSQRAVEHFYDSPGTYEVTFTVETSEGTTAEATRQVEVRPYPTKIPSPGGDGVEEFGSSVDYNADGTRAIVGDMDAETSEGGGAGAAYIYEYSNGTWDRTQKLVEGNRRDRLGKKVVLSPDGTIAVIGGGEGEIAYIFEKADREWESVEYFSGTRGFGEAIDMSADSETLLFGADERFLASGTGEAYIFTKNDGWGDPITFTGNDTGHDDLFGSSVELGVQGEVAFVGAPNAKRSDGERTGSVYIFERDGGDWNQTDKISLENASPSSSFGDELAFSAGGETLFVAGVTNEDDSGDRRDAVAIYEQSDGEWSLQSKISPTHGGSDDYFGSSIAVSRDGTRAVIGAPGDDLDFHPTDRYRADAGSAFLFGKQGGSWSELSKLTVHTEGSSDTIDDADYYTGRSVAIDNSGEAALVGSPGFDYTGATFVFDLTQE